MIDVSGDGANNRGRPAEDARDEAVQAGVMINGLPILTLEPELDVYYRQNVIGGPGAFVIAVKSYEEFRRGGAQQADHRDRRRRSGEHAVDVGLPEARSGSATCDRRVRAPAGVSRIMPDSMVSTCWRCSIARRIR